MQVRRLIALLVIAGCSADDAGSAESEPDDRASPGVDGSGGQGSGDFHNPTATIDGGLMAPRPTGSIDAAVPDDFVPADIGGYALGAPIDGTNALPGERAQEQASGCAQLIGVVRDFRGADEADPHPDFEVFRGRGATTGLVAAQLGADRKPVYASQCEAMPERALCPYGQMTTSEADFDAWYRSVAGVNQTFLLHLAFEVEMDVYTFESKAFFPLDGAGFGNAGGKRRHNFGFTTELHTRFLYSGGERFSFTGDDDLWVFINGKLAIDLGGLHDTLEATIDLDASAAELEITPGNAYPLDLFHAERHSAGSNFRVDTTLSFTDCGAVTEDLI